MTKKRFITWILACVALVIVAIPTIPHHHHSNMLGICMNVDDDVMGLDEICYCAVECKHSTNSTADKEDCNGKGCPASMHAIKAGTNQVQFEQNTLQLFNLNISEFVIVFLSSKSEIKSLDTLYLNNYYTTPPADIKSRRAPPFINV
ncbi:DUF6769 family protein [Bacteroides propionicifaciens]|uniref:DUF6769 family protein n=1 Tax=Bacteroides propionicifaciens TaxID=392838 RepID=UPI000376721E|nr:DUF6769 family protein [Bacteroides propionicifaciens]